MKTARLSDLVELSPGFSTAVDVRDDLGNDFKIAAYIPTEVASEILLDMAENLHVSASRRARLLTGTYGTGKSHLGLVMARLYRDGSSESCLAPVFKRLAGTWPGKAGKLREEREGIEGKFLLVLLTGDCGSFNDSLLQRLSAALASEGLQDLLPETAFEAARKRIQEIKKEHKETYKALEKAVRESGLESVEALRENLKQMVRSAYDRFCDIHKVVCAGAAFSSHHGMSPTDVYRAVAKKLADERGYAGIVVMWDEFGRYMERVVEDPRGMEGQSIQDFAQKGCNASHKHQIHLYLICHRSLQEYVGLGAISRFSEMSKSEQDEWNKIAGRFREFNMRSSDHETFHLIDQVLIQNRDTVLWREFADTHHDHFDDLTDQAHRLKLFPEFRRDEIQKTVTLGAYPLHPMTAFCLPKISQQVAQNERTMFRFLSDSGTDTLGPFLRDTAATDDAGRPQMLPADSLWRFFLQNVEGHPEHRRVADRFNHANVQVDADDDLAKRIIRAIALLEVISSDRAPRTEDVLRFCMGLSLSEGEALRENLKSLCAQEAGRPRVLHQNLDGTYRFAVAGAGVPLEEKIEEVVQERVNVANPAEHLRRISGEIGLESIIPATGYSDDFMLDRHLELALVDLIDLKDPTAWITDLGSGRFIDGRSLVILCETGADIRRAQELAATSLKHPQILIGIPQEPVRVAALLRKHDAASLLEKTQGNLYGPGADLRDEWEQQEGDLRRAILQKVTPLLDPQKQLLEWLMDGKELDGIRSQSRLRDAVSDMMRKVFPHTPRIAHDRSAIESGPDSPKRARRNIIDKLMQPDGPTLLGKETNSQEKTMIRAFYAETSVLRQVRGQGDRFEIAKPAASQNKAVSAVWDEIDAAVQGAKAEPLEMSDLVGCLRNSPYGMRTRTISLFVAAVFRPYILRGNLTLQQTRGGGATEKTSRITGQVLDDAILTPGKYRLVFVDIGEKHEAIILGIAEALGVDAGPDANKGALLDEIHAGLTRWWRSLTHFARETRMLDQTTLGLRDTILRPLASESADVHAILLEHLAEVMHPASGKERISKAAVSDLFGRIKGALENAVAEHLNPRINDVLVDVFGQEGKGSRTGADALRKWYAGLPAERRDVRIAGHPLILSARARELQTSGARDDQVPGELAAEISGTGSENWPDSMLEQFRGMLGGAKKTIEEADILSLPPDEPGKKVIVPVPKPGQVSVTILAESQSGFRRTFVPVEKVSPMGENLRNIIREAIRGIGNALPAGERETILIEVLRDTLK